MNENPSQPISSGPDAVTTQPTPPQRRRLLFPALLLIILVVFGIVYWVILTPSGQATWEFVTTGHKTGPEQEAAKDLEKQGLRVGYQPPHHAARYINLGKRPLKDEMFEQVSRLYRLQVIDGSQSQITDDQLRFFTGLGSLTGLYLSKSPVTDAGMKHVAACSSVQLLYLHDTAVTDEAMAEISKMRNVTMLDLVCTKITDKGLKQVARMQSLESLMIGSPAITDAGLDDLAEMKKLRYVMIHQSAKVTPAAIERLNASVPGISVEISKRGPGRAPVQ